MSGIQPRPKLRATLAASTKELRPLPVLGISQHKVPYIAPRGRHRLWQHIYHFIGGNKYGSTDTSIVELIQHFVQEVKWSVSQPAF